MSAFVLDHFMVPPGGAFYYVQPETGCRIEAGDYQTWMETIAKHRAANGIEFEPLWKLHVEEWLCHDLHTKGKQWCRVQGLGDIIAHGLRPIAHAADQYLGTNLANCNGCSNRQRTMNKINL
jgi:hypothetical protein